MINHNSKRSKKIILITFWLCSIAHSTPLDQAYFLVAQALKNEGKNHEAAEYLHKTIALNTTHKQALFELGIHYYQQAQIDQAAYYFERTCELDPHNFQAFMQAGACALAMSKIDTAIAHYTKATHINPLSPKAHFILGSCYAKNHQMHKAIESFTATLKLCPDLAEVNLQLANALRDSHQLPLALPYYEKAAVCDPSNIQITAEKAHALALLGETNQAISLYQEVEKKSPAWPALLYNMAYTYKKMGDYTSSIERYKQVVKNNPGFKQAHLGLASAYMGIHDYEHCFQELALSAAIHITEKPILTHLGQAHNKTILITASWNDEDMIQFLRFVPQLKAAGARIIVQCNQHLAPLLAMSSYIDQVFTPDKQMVPSFDMHIPLIALPALCLTHDKNMPPFVAYLAIAPDKDYTCYTKKQFDRMSVGLYWKSADSCDNRAEDKNVPFNALLPLLHNPVLDCYSLQAITPEEYTLIPDDGMITLMSPAITTGNDLARTAALLNQLDIIITCDSLVAHIAGALGKYTILILPEICQWRWGITENSTPFYPSIRVIRCKKDDCSSLTTEIMNYVGKYSSR